MSSNTPGSDKQPAPVSRKTSGTASVKPKQTKTALFTQLQLSSDENNGSNRHQHDTKSAESDDDEPDSDEDDQTSPTKVTHFGNDKPGQKALDVTSWLYMGNRLKPAPNTIDQTSTSEQLTSYYLDKVLHCRFNDCQKIIGEHCKDKTIMRLLEFKLTFKNGTMQKNLFEPTRQQQYSAILGYLFSDHKGSAKPCQTCASSRSEGPFRYCVFDSRGLFAHACANCQYKSSAKKCSIRTKQARIAESQLSHSGQASDDDVQPLPKPFKRVRPDANLHPDMYASTKRAKDSHSYEKKSATTVHVGTGMTGANKGPSWIMVASTEALTMLQSEIQTELLARVHSEK